MNRFDQSSLQIPPHDLRQFKSVSKVLCPENEKSIRKRKTAQKQFSIREEFDPEEGNWIDGIVCSNWRVIEGWTARLSWNEYRLAQRAVP